MPICRTKKKNQYNKFTLHGSLIPFHFNHGQRHQQERDWNFKWQQENLANCLVFRYVLSPTNAFLLQFWKVFLRGLRDPQARVQPAKILTMEGPPGTPELQ